MIKSIFDSPGETQPLQLPQQPQNHDVGKLEPEFHDVYQTWKSAPTPKTRGMFLNRAKPIVDRAISTYAPSQSPAIRSRAKILAVQALDTYDPAKGSLRNHLLANLRGLQRYQGQQANIIAIPERIALDRQHLREAEENLQDNLGRDPSDLELANYTGLSLRRITHIRSAVQSVASGSIMDEEGDVYSPASQLPGQSTDDQLLEMVYYDLGDIDKNIMAYTLGMFGASKISDDELAKRLGITRSAISQRRAKIQKMVDELRADDLFGE